MRFKRSLTAQELQVCVEAAAGGIEPCLVAFYDLALKSIGSSWDAEDSINPTEFAIPVEQSTTIIQASNPWFGLDWMNVGPSSYVE